MSAYQKPTRIFLSLLLLCSRAIVSDAQQDRFTISGYVRDAKTGEYLLGATVYLKELQKGGSTNPYGFYSITVGPGQYTLATTYIGYREYSTIITLDKDQR